MLREPEQLGSWIIDGGEICLVAEGRRSFSVAGCSFRAVPTGMEFGGMDCIRLLFWAIFKGGLAFHSIRFSLHG